MAGATDPLQRMTNLETTLTSIMDRMNGFAGQVATMMKTVEDNDISVKTVIESKVQEMESNYGKAILDATTAVVQQVQTLEQKTVFETDKMKAKSAETDVQISKCETDNIGMISQIQALVTDKIDPTGNEVIRIAATTQGILSTIDEVKKEVNTIKETSRSTFTTHEGGEREKRDFYKPITEYKSISDLGKLGNDKTQFRDWQNQNERRNVPSISIN